MFSNVTDIANRVADHLGAPHISGLSENSKLANYINSSYDKLRQAELQAHVWRFAVRAAPLRPITATTKLLIFPNYAAGTTYKQGDIVNDATANVGNTGRALYISLIAANLANTPSSATMYATQTWAPYFGPDACDAHSLTNTYSVGEMAYLTTSTYMSLANGEINHTPPSTGAWGAALTGVTNELLFIPWPITQINSGATRSAYRLPFGYMRVASQDPKIAGGSFQTVSAGMQWSDFQFIGNYLLTASSTISGITNGPLIFRFVADITDVTMMEPLFAELLATRIAYEMVEAITQNPTLKKDIAAKYDQIMGTARRDNMIELGSTDPAEQQYPLSRLPEAAPAPAQR